MTSKAIAKLIKDARKLRKTKTRKDNIIPYGLSYVDVLPDDLLHEIFKTKHAMEFTPTLDTIKKFRFVQECEPFKTKMSIKTLLSPITKRKLFHIDVEKYEGNIEFKANAETIKNIETMYNVSVNLNKPNDPLSIYSYRDKYTDALIKWRNNYTASVLDVICITKALDIRCASSYYVLCDLLVEDLNRKKDDVSLIFIT